MKKNYVVYMHTNVINGKIYIGITCQKPEYRWHKDGGGYKECPHFWRAIQKYGWENFKHEIIARDLTKQEACEMEISLIKKKHANDPNHGYNITQGGDGINSQVVIDRWKNEEYRKFASNRMREAWKDETKRKRRSDAAKERWKNVDFKKKATESLKKACASAVRCIETGEVFACIRDAENRYKLNHSNICRAIRTGYKCGGYHWAYLDDVS